MFRTTLYLLSKVSVISWFVACCKAHPNLSRRLFCLSSRNLCFCHLGIFSLTCCSDLLEKVGITSTECWVSPLLTGGVAVPDHLLDEAVSTAACRHQLLRCCCCNCPSWGRGRGAMFILCLSQPVLPSLITSVHYRETPRKNCLPRRKGERSTWKCSSTEKNMRCNSKCRHLWLDVVCIGVRNSLRSRARTDKVQFVHVYAQLHSHNYLDVEFI